MSEDTLTKLFRIKLEGVNAYVHKNLRESPYKDEYTEGTDFFESERAKNLTWLAGYDSAAYCDAEVLRACG